MNTQHVTGMDSAGDVNRAIGLPEKLYSSDGRVFHIRGWCPRMHIDECVSVKIEAIVEIPDRDKVDQ